MGRGALGELQARGPGITGGYRCGGEQVVPKDAEDVLLEHPAVAQALVVPVPDPKMGEAGAAFIVRRPGSGVDAEELTASGRPRKFLLAQRAAAELSWPGVPRNGLLSFFD